MNEFSLKRPLFIGFVALIILIIGFGSWGMTAEIAGAIIAPGRVEVDNNRQVVQHPTGGRVDAIHVDEGTFVAAGDRLITLDSRDIHSELAVIESQLFEIIARRSRLVAERDNQNEPVYPDYLQHSAPDLVQGQTRLFHARQQSHTQHIAQLIKRRDRINSQITGLKAQQNAMHQQADLLREELDNQQALLDKGLSQSTRVLTLKREQAALMGELGKLSAAIAQTGEQVTEMDLEILRLDTTRRETAIAELRDIRQQEFNLVEQRRTLQNRLAQNDIRAPVSGVVYGLNVFAPQSVIGAGDALLYIIPQDQPLIVTAQIAPMHIDQVFVGQSVILRLPAFDQRTTPELTGHLAQVSPDAFEDPNTGQSYYRAEITVNAGELGKLPAGKTLIPGMPVDSLIKTQDRTLFSYLIKPLRDYFAQALRES